ncbi:uncharacterized protein LOC133785249 [Humulus lupulus]|uniref:uncharacterized protein LOC133785249 n=1 Tax=Humulus lupulus TaxID=3486 RepID=UPI002B40B5A7|nr:uncharacterized protein LOC133785249 [Humulus lupulus]
MCALVQTSVHRPKLMNLRITLTKEDARNVYFPHHDHLVIDTQITNKRVSRVLVDNGSFANLLFKLTFTAIGLTEVELDSCLAQIYDFNGDSLLQMGKIQLPITLGNDAQNTFKYYTFVVVDCPIAYNVIFGHPALVDFGVVTSIRHLYLKFPCDNDGLGTIWGDQKNAQKCSQVSSRSIFMVREEPLEEEDVAPISQPQPARGMV